MRLLIDKCFIDKGNRKIRHFWGVSFAQPGISQPLLLDDRLCRGIEESLASGGREIVAIQPIGNLLIVPPLLAEIAYQPIQQLLIGGIGCNPEISKSDFYCEGKKDICG